MSPNLSEVIYLRWCHDERDSVSNHRRLDLLAFVSSTVCSDADQRKYQSSTSLAFVSGIHRWPVFPLTKGQQRGKCLHLMTSSWFSVLSHMYLALDHTEMCYYLKSSTLCVVLGNSSHDWEMYKWMRVLPRVSMRDIDVLLSIPKLQMCGRCSLGMRKYFHSTLHWAYDYLSMLG